VRVPVKIGHHELEEEYCYYDKLEKAVLCADYEAELDYEVADVEFEYTDLVDVVNEYFDDIVDIILRDKKLLNKLLKKLSIQEKSSKH
jgi:hypothetical protein